MKRHTIAIVGLAVLLVASGTAIAAPTSTTTESAQSNATESAQPNETRDAGAQADTDGPPSALPDAVPDQVDEIHRTIQQFLDGEDGSLGDALSDLLGQNGDRASNDVTTTTEG